MQSNVASQGVTRLDLMITGNVARARHFILFTIGPSAIVAFDSTPTDTRYWKHAISPPSVSLSHQMAALLLRSPPSKGFRDPHIAGISIFVSFVVIRLYSISAQVARLQEDRT